ncbi:MAG: hypothetical protein OXE17_08245 [Chloroflexi bacterium]|nr:hypothetical protein [Chloroflexota bacterium]
MALALAAVFGSMSLANPAMAQAVPAAPTGLEVTAVTDTTVTVKWTKQAGYEDSDYRVRASLRGVPSTAVPVVDGGTGDGTPAFGVAIGPEEGDADEVVVSGLTVNERYVIEIQSNKDSDPGDFAMIDARPVSNPTFEYVDDANGAEAGTSNLLAVGGRGEITLTWYNQGDDVANVTGWEYQVCDDADCADATDGTKDPGWQAIAAGDLETTAGEDGATPPADSTKYETKISASVRTEGHHVNVRPVNGLNKPTTAGDGAPSERVVAAPAVSEPLPLLGMSTLTATGGDGQIALSWTRVVGAASYTYVVSYEDADGMEIVVATITTTGSEVFSDTVSGLLNEQEYTVKLNANAAMESTTHRDGPAVTAMASTTATTVEDVGEVAPSFSADSSGAGSSTFYTLEFQLKDDDDENTVSVNTRQYDLIIEFNEDYSIPASISTTSVAMTTRGGTYLRPNNTSTNTRTFTPEDVTVDGSEVFISLGDMDEQDDRFDYLVEEPEVVTVLFRQSAGISNPTAADAYDSIVKITFGDLVVDNEDGAYMGLADTVPHSISIDPEDGGLGTEVTVKGKGFKNDTSMTFFRDADNNGELTSVDAVLCTDPLVEGNIGTCTFEVTHPTFTAGKTNHIDGVDGVAATADGSSKVFELKASIIASPSGGSPGEMILVQLVDFEGSGVTQVRIGGEIYCHDSLMNRVGELQACEGGIDSGSGSFSIEIPNWARGGIQELKVWDNASPDQTSASTKVTLVGPQIRLTRETVVANQRISLIGTGFSPGAAIANVNDLSDPHTEPAISIGGDRIDPRRINDGDPVRVDNGGNWSASVDLPLSEATTAAGNREIRVRDSLSRIGVVDVVVLDRTVTVTPNEGRVGTIAVVRGEGFPSKNDEGSNFTVEIEYEASNGNAVTVSALTDASGDFEQQLRIPTTAAIPSSNQIHVRFEDDEDVPVSITVPHEVPEGIIQPSETSGGPGSSITIMGEGFKSFVPVALVKIGTLDVTPAPKPSTDGNGMMSFDILIPGLDVGIQTIEVNVGRTTASVGFTVTESGVNPGDIKPVAEGLEELGDNLDVIWHFNNDTKEWSFYDGQEGSTLTHVITGETYLILVKGSVEVILNRDTRSLSCVGGNCWNQIVW